MEMNLVLALFFSSLISFAVSTVEVTDGPLFAKTGFHFNLKCIVSSSDSFDAWKNPAGVVVKESDNFQFTQSGEEHILNIVNVQAKYRGVWTCWSKTGYSDSVTLNVVGADILRILHMGSAVKQQYLTQGVSGIIKVNIWGYPQPHFKWLKNGHVLDMSSERYSTSHNGNLMISNVDFEDEGMYSVGGKQLSYESYITDIAVTVRVPSVKVRNGPFTVAPWFNFQLTCVVSGGDTFKAWKSPSGVLIKDNARFQSTHSGEEHKLKIKRVQVKDGGVWTCLSKTGYSDSVTLNVMVSEVNPGSTEKQQYLMAGLPGLIKVDIGGYPQPYFEWTKNGEFLSFSSGRYSTTSEGSLIISNVDFNDKGTYAVIAVQEYAEVEITGIVVSVRSEMGAL